MVIAVNGTLLDREKAERLKRGVFSVSLSLDARMRLLTTPFDVLMDRSMQ